MLTFVTQNKRDRLIIFIHGFIGGRETWVRNDNKLSILDYLEKDESISAHYDTAVFDYFTKLSDLQHRTKSWLGKLLGRRSKMLKNIAVKNLSKILASEIDVSCADYSDIVLIAHSMGGLVAKSYLLDEIKRDHKNQISTYISLSVPHNGSNLATLGRIIISNPQIKDLKPLSEAIDEMNNSWIASSAHLPATLYFQGQYDNIVPNTSSVAFDVRDKTIIYTDDDHFSIVIPERKDDIVIKAIKKQLLKNLNSTKDDSPDNTSSLPVTSSNAIVVTIKFNDAIRPSEVSIKTAVGKGIDENIGIIIKWPDELLATVKTVEQLSKQVEHYDDSNSIFYKLDERVITSFQDSALSSLKYANTVLSNAPNRVYTLLKGMEKYWGAATTDSIHLKTLKNYLTLCNFTVQSRLCYSLSHSTLKEKYFPAHFNEWFEISRTRNWPVKLFEMNTEALFWARVYNVSGYDLNNEYFWGAKHDIIEAYYEYNNKHIINAWFREHLIPQVELFLAENSRYEIIDYDECAGLNKVCDEEFKEYLKPIKGIDFK